MKATLSVVPVLLAICLVLGGQEAKAQGVGSSADLTGTVTDPAGANVPNARVSVVTPRRA